MVCSNSVTVIGTPTTTAAIVTNVSGAARSEIGTADIQWRQDKAGKVSVKVDALGSIIDLYPVGLNYITLSGLKTGTHNICVEGVV